MSAQTLLQMPQVRPPSITDVVAGAVGNHSVPFPWKLHELLDVAESDNFTNIVSWLPDQRSFRVHDIPKFVDSIMKRYFKQTKYKSFQRQLNMWGFERLLNGPGKGGYSHTYFIRGKRSLCCHMTRLKVKGTGSNGNGASSPLPSKVRSLTLPPAATSKPAHASSVRPPMALTLSAAVRQNIQVPQISDQQDKNKQGETQNSFFEEGILDQVLQCALFDKKAPSGSSNASGNSVIPTEGDSVLFEGRQFFLVDDYNQEPPSSNTGGNVRPRTQRRMSIEFAPVGISQNTRRPRRLSLLPVNPMDGASCVPSQVGSGAQHGQERKYVLEPISQPSRKQRRRFSLERVISSTTNPPNSGVNLSTAAYVLCQLPS